jgi:phosphatidylserine/phosphatidylglycerophosphate/cardiolipin synthase-like enzyme
MRLALVLLVFFPLICHAEINFTSKCEKEVVSLINHSEEKIDIAVYSINNLNIIDALHKGKDRGVKINILTDRLQAFGKSSKVELLHNSGFNIRVHSHDRIMHHKFAIFDGKKAVEGSFNWTYSAAHKNSEDCNIFEKEEDVATLQKRFNKLWRLNKKDISECYFRNMKVEKGERVKCY